MAKVETTYYSIGDDKLTAIADAIRSQTDTEDTMTTDVMVRKINNMMSAIGPYLGKEFVPSSWIAAENHWILVPFEEGEFTLKEVEDPGYEFDSDHQVIFVPGIITVDEREGTETVEECAPIAGVHLIKGGTDKFIQTPQVFLDIRFTNPEDENDGLNHCIYHGHFTEEGDYRWYWYDEGEDHDVYEMTIDRPSEDTDYVVTMKAYVENYNDFDLPVLVSDIVTCEVTITGAVEEEL